MPEPILELPRIFYPYENKIRWLHFGTKKEKCIVSPTNATLSESNNYHKPYHINISETLINSLFIPKNFIYQLKISTHRLELGPTIGLLLGERNHMYHPDYMEKYSDRFGVYKQFGGAIIAFSPRSIDWVNQRVFGFLYNLNENKWFYGDMAIPNTIYRRNFHQNQDRLEEIMKENNGRLFNSTRYDKWQLYTILLKNPFFSKHLPKTFLLKNFEEMINFLNQNKKIIIKPIALSRGRGILVLEVNHKIPDKYIMHDYRDKKKPMSYSLSKEKISEILKQEHFFESEHLYQSYIPLVKIDHSPFDIRIVMQKNHLKEWQCNGIECRIAGEREQITNISRGGKAKTLKEAISMLGPQFDYSKIYQEIMDLSLEFCRWMDLQDEHFAEFGLDVGLDQDGFPWFIEANVFPSFKGFKSIDMEQYLTIRYQPFTYAAGLQGFYQAKNQRFFIRKDGLHDYQYNRK